MDARRKVEGRRQKAEGRRPTVVVIDYGAGNLTSVRKALAASGADAFVAEGPDDIYAADGVVVPGVGHFAATTAIDAEMRKALLASAGARRPILGICLGLQFLFAGSEEAPGLDGLDLVPGRCRLLPSTVKVPHVGWNTIDRQRDSALLEGVADGAYVYFTHSYAAPIGDACVATTAHGAPFAAVVETRGIYGVQFHPEKSGEPGLRVLRNFVSLC
jgi:glutamine amidotransferase